MTDEPKEVRAIIDPHERGNRHTDVNNRCHTRPTPRIPHELQCRKLTRSKKLVNSDRLPAVVTGYREFPKKPTQRSPPHSDKKRIRISELPLAT